MRYKSTRRLPGSEPAALKAVRDALIANGFTVSAAGQSEFTVLGPGLRSTRQNPIRGISKGVVRTRGSTIEMDAELGGAVRLGRFAMIFPLALTLVLAVALAVSQRRQPAAEPANLVSLFLLPVLWLVLGPVLAWRVRKRTEGAIEALLASAAEVARAG